MTVKKSITRLLVTGLLLSAAASAFAEKGDWLIRSRIIYISPNDDSGAVAINGAGVAGSGVSVNGAATIDIDFTYMFTNNFGVELLLDLSSKHDVKATGTLAGLGTILETRVLPPALIAQYHFRPAAKFRPYIGAGVNYTIFFDEKAKGSLNNAIGTASSVDFENSTGLVAQLGADFALNDDWFMNVDAKYMTIDTTVKVNTQTGNNLRVNADIDPFVLGVGIGRRF